MKPLKLLFLAACLSFGWCALAAEPLAGTKPLTLEGDLAAQMVSGIDRYLDGLLVNINSNRTRAWALTVGSAPGANQLVDALLQHAETNRRLRDILGVVDQRQPVRLRFVGSISTNAAASIAAEVGRAPGYFIYAVAWNVFRGLEGEGLLLVPEGEPKADIIAVPDCDTTPEQLVGLAPGTPSDQQFARRFAEAGCRVIVPALIDRGDRFGGEPGTRPMKHSQRETLWRAGYEMGRIPLGYEIQKVLAAADWLDATRAAGPRIHDRRTMLERIQNPGSGRQELGIVGYGEGGLIALYAGALDPRFLAVGVCGAFGLSQRSADLPIYRNVWSILQRFGDAELARMVVPRALIVEHGRYPEVVHTDQDGGAPGKLWRPSDQEFAAERERYSKNFPDLAADFLNGPDTVCAWPTAQRFYRKLASSGSVAQEMGPLPVATSTVPDSGERLRRQYFQTLEDIQTLVRESAETRRDFWKKADFSNLAAFTNSARFYHDYFRSEIIGLLPAASLPPNPRSRLLYETNGIRGYEVVLNVYPEVFAYGILVVPADLRAGERRPVVVCQHGLEGRPRDVADPAIENPAYHQYACQLARRGFVTFAPQNPYIGRTVFRQVLRKAQPLGVTLFSFILRQHQVITDWLASLDFVDPERIAFYGLSYGGKTAMRIPALLDRYCLSICSADYNEWIWKTTSARSPYSYLWTMEYDMPEFNLGNTFNYAEMSWLIFPRPFMVERGHDDGVAPDEWVAYEFARTRRHYVKMGLADRAAIEFFNGPHSINGKGTFDFLHAQLRWPKP